MSTAYGAERRARAPAPGRLKLVQQFVNSLDIEASSEDFQTRAELRTWLVSHGLAKPRGLRLTSKDLDRARRFRELVRELAAGNNGMPQSQRLQKELNRELASLPLIATVEGEGTTRLVPARDGLDQALAQIAAIVVEEMISGRWNRMKACAQEICRWVFYDHSRSRTGIWCTMAVCGSRAKSRAYYRRRTAG